MPYGVLICKPGVQEIGLWLAPQLPPIVAPALSLDEEELHNGKVTPKEIMIVPMTNGATVNGNDLELVIFAHNFPKRVENLEERKKQILVGIESLMSGEVRKVTVAVCIITAPMAYGEFRLR